jgi:hypothetical protein
VKRRGKNAVTATSFARPRFRRPIRFPPGCDYPAWTHLTTLRIGIALYRTDARVLSA